ncbi:YkvA family protein [Lewinella sp. IMCC34183]|uniref:YkvA family protein n=1 Tax=Lewinella sp. IMCC34183 TaxID=2248762 RepID=UPI000E24D916|nr:YkvA family protein [Lewinella sp. IMCC34183]
MNMPSFPSYFTPKRFWARLGSIARAAGTKTVYSALLLYYAYERKDTPAWAKRTILGVLGYLLMPLDAVPDLTPILGYTDDLGVLAVGLATVAVYINRDVRDRARAKLGQWLPDAAEADVQAIEDDL